MKRSRGRALGLRVAAGGVVLVAAALVIALLYLHTAVPERDGSRGIDGVKGPVQVLWDAHAVPHIRAGSVHDALVVQGYVHARDRLWQMEVARHAVQGRLAEMLGPQALETDRFMRRLGIWDAAVAAAAKLGPREQAWLEAYADGVNAAIRTRAGALPPELLVLGHHPEPWTPAQTLGVAKMMSLTLASYGETVAVARAIRRLGPERSSYLFPAYPAWGATILEPHGAAEADRRMGMAPSPAPLPPAGDLAAGLAAAPLPPEPPETPSMAAALLDAFSIAAASNAWAVAGRRTVSGKPILANDTHLELQAPSLWYLVGLHAPSPDPASPPLDVVGVSIPGAPLVVIGHNAAVAWGMTNAYVDDVDLFIERIDPADSTRYLVPGGSEPFRVRTDTIRVKGREDPVLLRVRSTRHGPVLPLGDSLASGDSVLALQWTAHRTGTVFSGIIGMNFARNWTEFLTAVEAMDDPHQNLVYADTAGHIGYVMGGTVPVRGTGRPPPVAPVPGWTGDWDWTGELPFSEHPRVLDPPDGFVVTANNRQTRAPVGDLIATSWESPFRAMRIRDMILQRHDLTAADIHVLQLDVGDLYARRYLRRAVRAAEDAGLAAQAVLLRGWDARASGDSRAATLFYLWNELTRQAVAEDLYRGAPAYFPATLMADILERGALPWADSGATRFRELAEAAMREAAPLSDRPWREANRVVHSHILGSVRALDALFGFDVGPFPHHGSPTTVNVSHWAYRSPAESFPFTTTAGPSEREVVDLGNLDGAGGFVIGTGQGGIPFDRHYRDQVEMWRTGGLIPLPLQAGAVERLATERLNLTPSGNER